MSQFQATTSAVPQATLGNPVTGIGSDPTRLAFGRYNVHVHKPSIPDDLRATKLRPLQLVSVPTQPSLFPTGTTIERVEPKRIILSSPATQTANEVTLLIGDELYSDFDTVQNSNVVSVRNRSGFLTAQQSLCALTEHQSGLLTTDATLHPILLSAPYSGVVIKAAFRLVQGSASVDLFINTRQILSVSTLSNTTTSSTLELSNVNNTAFIPGDDITLQLRSPQPFTQLAYSVYYLKSA